MEDKLKVIYYDYENPGSFGGASRLVKSSNIPHKKVRDWLMTQDTYTLHKNVKHKYSRRRTLAFGSNETWQADLMDLKKFASHNSGTKYLLTIIDIFSKYAYAVPLKNKNALSLLKGFKSVFKHQKPKNLQTDRGSEFYNKHVQNLFATENVFHYSTHSDTKASVVERFNRTLKEKLFRVFTYRNSYKYADVLNSLIKSYNHSVHRSIGIAPVDVTPDLEAQIFQKLYGFHAKIKYIFDLGDQVRISKVKKTFRRGYLPGWTYEVFEIHQRYPTYPPTYILRDLKGDILKGRFYAEELQRVKKTSKDFWVIESIIRTKGRGQSKEYFVKWKGFDNRFNSWVKAPWMKQYQTSS